MKLPLISVLLAGAAVAAPPSNSVIIRNLQSAAEVNRPFTVSRVFSQGEIPHFAQARIGGSPVLTQCDVKTRWSDGSLKHALVSFRGDLPGSGSLTVDFVDQATGNNSGYLATTAEMLAPSWMTGSPAWDAEMQLSNGTTTLTKNVRSMLQRLSAAPGQIRYWMQGPIVTQVIVEDRTTALSEDFGFDSYKALHPIFVVTFYPGWQGVKVEYILENVWNLRTEDQVYALDLRAGSPPASAYTKASFTHFAKTRWHKTFWSGADLDRVNGALKTHTDLNRAYLSYSYAIPNYDPTKTPPATTITGALAVFNRTDRGDINGSGQFAKDFGTTGGREEIGLYPTWEARYLTSFAPELYDVVLGNGNVSAHVPIHVREADTSRGAFFGKYVSLDSRPTSNGQVTVGPTAASGWSPDLSHQAAFGFIPYLITGDWYWLEEMQFWGTAIGQWSDPGTCSYCRNGAMGIITQPHAARGLAWGLRNYAHAAWFTPDADAADKAYFAKLTANTLGAYEGKLDIRNGAYYNTPQWTFGNQVIAPNRDGGVIGLLPDPLGFVNYNSNCTSTANGMDPTKVSFCDAPWMNNYLRAALGRLIELGFPAGKLLEVSSKELINGVLNPEIGNPYLVGSYIAPRTVPSTLRWFQTWTEYGLGYLATERAKTSWSQISPSSNDADPDNGYPHLARGAASFITGMADGPYTGQATYDWLNANVNLGPLASNPKWALIPRTSGSPSTPVVVSSRCDVNGDSVVDILDVQAAVNATLGTSTVSVDLDGNGRTNVVDVQRVVNAALGAPCRIGP